MADLTADAVILKRIFSDDFNRVSIQGLGGAWSWYIYDSWPAESSDAAVMQVDGSAATIQSFTGDSFYESWVGFPLPLTGDLFFDFHVPATFSSNRPVYGFALDVVHYSGVYVTAWDSADWHVGTWKTADNFAIFTPTPSTWYRVHLRWTTERAYINVWKAADSEPAGWLYDETSAFDFAGDTKQPPFLDVFYSPTGPTVGKMDNVEIWTSQSQWTGFGGFFADAIIAPHFTADAIIVPLRVSADALLMKILGDGTVTSPTINASYSRGTAAGLLIVSAVPTAANGDLLLFICDYDSVGDSNRVWTAPPGWNLVQNALTTNGDTGLFIFSKIKTSTDTGNVTITASGTGSVTSTAMIIGINGVDPSAPIPYSGLVTDINSVTSHPTGSIVSPVEGLLVLAAGGSLAGTWTPPADMTEKAEGLGAGALVSLAVDTETITNGTVGVKTAVSSIGMASSLVWLVVQSPGRFFRADAFLVESRTQFRINAVIVAKETARLDAVIRKERRSYATRVIDDGASAYYKFDVESGTLTAGYTFLAAVGPNGRLTSGYSYTGIVVTGGLQSASPALGTGWLFGASSNPPILFTPYAQKSSSKASAEGWIKTSQTSTFLIWDPYHWMDSIFHPGGGIGTGNGLSLSMGATGKIILRIEPDRTQIETTSTFNDDVWHHVVGVWDGTDGVITASAQFKIYVDGVEQSTTSSGTGLTAPLAGNPEGSLMAGWGYYGSKGQLIGGIDEVAFYNYTALSPTQVMDHYRAGLGIYMPDIVARAVIRHPDFGVRSFRADAYVVNPFRTQHPRDNTAHYDLDLDTFIVLAQALEVYPVGEDLHTVLTGILDRLDFLEGRSNDYPPSFGADAVLFKPDIGGSLTIDAVKSRSVEETMLVDAIVRLVYAAEVGADAILLWSQEAAFTANVVLRREVEYAMVVESIIQMTASASLFADATIMPSFQIDAIISNGSVLIESTVEADAILLRSQAASFTADVVLQKVVSATMAADSVVQKAASASLTINAFIQPYFRADAVIAASGGAFQSDTFQNNAFG
jgi:hypothetical protein